MLIILTGAVRKVPSTSSGSIFLLSWGFCRLCSLMCAHIFFTTCISRNKYHAPPIDALYALGVHRHNPYLSCASKVCNWQYCKHTWKAAACAELSNKGLYSIDKIHKAKPLLPLLQYHNACMTTSQQNTAPLLTQDQQASL